MANGNAPEFKTGGGVPVDILERDAHRLAPDDDAARNVDLCATGNHTWACVGVSAEPESLEVVYACENPDCPAWTDEILSRRWRVPTEEADIGDAVPRFDADRGPPPWVQSLRE